ncbi:MAG: oxidoreductase [Elusimicrobia bacterium]|nr:MAG: oxidoreductase [Elusimicrobiota bacterium]
MSSLDKIRVAVLGYGHWGPHHLRVFNTIPHSEVLRVADMDSKRLEQAKKVAPHVQGTKAASEIFSNPEIDAVIIATPTTTHFELAKKALKAKKHLLCEKPLCKTEKEGAELVALAKENGCILMVGHVFLYNSAINTMKGMIDSELLGDIYYATSTRTNLGPIRSDADVSYDLATHDISIFNWFFQAEPLSVSASGGEYLQPGLKDVVFISLRYPNNRLVHIHVSWIDPKKIRQMTLVGSKKMVTWNDLEPQTPIAVYDKGAMVTPGEGGFGEYLRVSMWDGDVRLPKIPNSEPMMVQANAFLDAIRNNRVEKSDGDFSLGVIRTLEAVDRSLKASGAPVELSK